jgi:hypothetical protein
LGLTLAQLWYQGRAPSYRTIFAEDGQVFYADAIHQGLGSLTHPYAGYLVTVTRLLAIPGTWLPTDRLADYLALAGALAGSLIALAVYHLTDQAIESRILRAALAFAVALHPVLAGENLANITNILWVLLFATFWALLRRPTTRADIVLAAVIVFLGATSTTLAVVFLPVAAWALWSRREFSTAVVVSSYGIGLFLQVIAYLSTSDHGPEGHASGLATLYFARVLGVTAVGTRGARDLWNSGGRSLLFPFGGAFIVLVIVLVVSNRGIPRALGLVTAAYSVVLFALPLSIRGTAPITLGSVFTEGDQRYAVLPVLFLITSLTIMVSHLRCSPRTRAILGCVVAAQLVTVTALSIHTKNSDRSDGPEWYPELVATARLCDGRPVGTREVPIAPAPWQIPISCRDLLSVAAH